jgi:hypothetical protein
VILGGFAPVFRSRNAGPADQQKLRKGTGTFATRPHLILMSVKDAPRSSP